MAFRLDPEVAAALAPMAAAAQGVAPPAVGDIATRRATTEAMMRHAAEARPMPGSVRMTDEKLLTADGAELLLRWYSKDAAAPGSAAVYFHGGGMIMGDVDLFDGPVARYVDATGVPLLSVDYRVAPEHPHPVPVEDCYLGLRWLADHAGELGVDPARIAVMGDSAGAGLAAAVALMARDRGGPRIARQVLMYPMLDDRTVAADAAIAPFAVWTYDDNITGWSALLGDGAGGNGTSPYAAPARASDLGGLPPLYLEVGELDIFRDEGIDYVRRTADAGTSVELHVRPGVPHHFDSLAPDSDVARRAYADRVRVLRSL
jgi:acetyl esterase/lipase